MPSQEQNAPSLAEIADRVMVERGLLPTFPEEVQAEIKTIEQPAKPSPAKAFRDLRSKPWLSIDNDDSKDLDQLTFAERTSEGKDHVFVAVADVTSLVKRGSATDNYAAHNTTSVYTPTKIYPMLPPKLSTNLTSLNEDVDRCAIVSQIEITVEGEYRPIDIFAAQVRNHAKLAYHNVTDHLQQEAALQTQKASLPWLSDQLRLQDEIAQRIKGYRDRQGALVFGTFQVESVVVRGVAVGLEEKVDNRAHQLIENFMISANVAVTRFLAAQRLPTLRRVVRTPENWDRIVLLAKKKGGRLPSQPDGRALQKFLEDQHRLSPETFPDLSLAIIKLIGRGEYIAAFPGEQAPGHFDLAILDYAHTTAPNRRYPDVVMQRLVTSHLFGTPIPYNEQELADIARNCTQKETAASKVERRMQKSASALVMSQYIGETYQALVTGASSKGTWVRVTNPPVEGKLVSGAVGIDVGDIVTVALLSVDVVQGFIDFARV